jgi:hypothetical protein
MVIFKCEFPFLECMWRRILIFRSLFVHLTRIPESMVEHCDQNVGQLERAVDDGPGNPLSIKLDLLSTNARFRSSVREIDTIGTPHVENVKT